MPASAPHSETLPDLLHRVFGHREFRPHQREVCEAAASGRDVLLVMPTGAGKSLCYQLPALALRGTALVISPLIALMDDQSSKLSQLGLRVATIHSGRDREASRQACRDYLSGDLDFLFIAPERMRVPGFPEMLARRKPALVAIDEAHCISQWGHDFRPDYRTLGQFLPALRPAPIIALTATATPTVQRDIAHQLNLQRPGIFITGFRRSNLAVEVVELSKPQRAPFALKLLQEASARPAIIYAQSRKDAEELASTFHKHFPTAAYHAGLDPGTRDRVQRAFLSGKLDVVVATVAFGMGVDKADVRTVIHAALPGSVEAYYQEIGRAGRDGLPSRTILLHGFADRRLQEFFLERNYPPITDLQRVASTLPEEFSPVNDLHNALLKKRIQIDRETLDRSIEKLLATGVALMDISGDVRLADGGPSPAWESLYQQQVAARRAQIDRMIAFAESTTCRMAALVQHFGDTSDTAPTCGLCDICNPSGNSASSAHQPTTEERSKLRSILRALEGRGTSTGKLFTDLKLTRERADFDTLLDALARAGLITIQNDTFRTPEGIDRTYKKANITEEGRDPDDRALDTVWIRGTLTEAPRRKSSGRAKGLGAPSSPTASSSAKVGSHTLNPETEALFESLRSWRTEQARPTKTPAFMILSDAVMRSIANANPQTLADLNAISGMGPSKVDRYGADIIAICRGGAPATRSTTTSASPRPNHPSSSLSSRPERSEVERHLYSSRLTTNASSRPDREPVQGALQKRPAPAATRQPQPPAELTPTQQALNQNLRAWRIEQATAAGLPTFFILADSSLDRIVRTRPQTLDDLRGIQGIPADKIDRFGPAVLALCRT